MGYWGYKATESDSALDYLARVTEHLEKMWDEAKDYGQKMAIVYILTEAPVVDITDYSGLKAKAVAFVASAARVAEERAKAAEATVEAIVEDCVTSLSKEALETRSLNDSLEVFNEREALENSLKGFNERYAQVTYLQGLIKKLQAKQGTSLGKKLQEYDTLCLTR